MSHHDLNRSLIKSNRPQAPLTRNEWHGFFSCAALHAANQATGGAAGTVSSGNAFIGCLYLLMCLGSWAADRESNREAVVHLSG